MPHLDALLRGTRDRVTRLAPLFVPGRIDPDSLEERDPAFIRAELPALGAFAELYFHPDVRGLKLVPDGPFLAVGNHSAGVIGTDVGLFLVKLLTLRGADLPLYAVAHDLVAKLYPAPIVRYIARFGALRASPENVARVFARGGSVLVYPGGDVDALRPFRRRHEVVFDGRQGFIRTALRHGVPIVPVVTCGAHEALLILTDGRSIARRLGLDRRFRLNTFPLALGLPWGFFPALLPYLPVPGRISIRVLEPIRLDGPPQAADDPVAVRAGYDLVVGRMQAALSEMAGARSVQKTK